MAQSFREIVTSIDVVPEQSSAKPNQLNYTSLEGKEEPGRVGAARLRAHSGKEIHDGGGVGFAEHKESKGSLVSVVAGKTGAEEFIPIP